MKEKRNDPASQILHALRKSDTGMTTDDLCRVLKVTPMAVHRPITLLLEQGLVSARPLREAKRGRPVHFYRLTEKAAESFPNSYGRLLLELLKELDQREGVRRIRRFFETRFKALAGKNGERIQGKNLKSRIESLLEVLRENDYIPEQEQISAKRSVIKLFNCPISQVAKEYPMACSCEQRSLAELLNAKIERDHHLLKGQNYCSYIVKAK